MVWERFEDMPLVQVQPGGFFRALREFRRRCQAAGIKTELRRRRQNPSMSDRRRAKIRKAAARRRKETGGRP